MGVPQNHPYPDFMMRSNGDSMGFSMIYPLVTGKSLHVYGKIHHF